MRVQKRIQNCLQRGYFQKHTRGLFPNKFVNKDTVNLRLSNTYTFRHSFSKIAIRRYTPNIPRTFYSMDSKIIVQFKYCSRSLCTH